MPSLKDLFPQNTLRNLRLQPIPQSPISTDVEIPRLPGVLPEVATLESRKPNLSELFEDKPQEDSLAGRQIPPEFGTFTPADVTAVPIAPPLQKESTFDNLAKSFNRGVFGFDIPIVTKEPETIPEHIAATAGFAVPIGASIKILKGIPLIKNLFGAAPKNFIVRALRNTARGGAVGATTAGLQESTRAVLTGEIELNRIKDDALLFAAFDLGFTVLGVAARPLVRAIRKRRWSEAGEIFEEIKGQIPEGDRKFGELFFSAIRRGEKPNISRADVIEYLNVQRLNILTNPVDDLAAYYISISAPSKFRPSAKFTTVEKVGAKKQAAQNLGITLLKTKKGNLIALKGQTKALLKETQKILQEARITAAQEKGIAIRTTKGGKEVPSVRESGPFITREFAEYKNFKDISHGLGGTKDPTRAMQEIDGALSVAEKVKLEGQAGPVEKHVLWRTRDITLKKSDWLNRQATKLRAMTQGISNEEAITANRVLEKINEGMVLQDTGKLAKQLGADKKIVKFAQEARRYFDELLNAQNTMRELRRQAPIKRRKFYSPQELQNISLWERTFGLNKLPSNIMQGKFLPDFVRPNAPFNARALARKNGLKEFEREMNLKRLLENYTGTAGNDIFNTSIIQNNKAASQQLRSMGLDKSALFIEDWTSEVFANTKGFVDRRFLMGNTARSLSNWFRRALVRTVFPLNIGWSLFIQTSSANLTTTRYGFKNSFLGAVDWFTNPQLRRDIAKNAYSFIVKAGRAGKITEQDINRGISKGVKIEKSPLESVQQAANYFTEWIERHLTGWSVATGRRAGFKRGLRDKALWEFASDAGAKTQSMYNYEDLPGILRNDIVKTVAPFQTFNFEVFNTMKEFMGKTGTPPSTQRERMAWMLRFLAGISATNAIGTSAIGRKPWDFPGSFIPFYSIFYEPIAKKIRGESFGSISTRGLPAPTGIAVQLANAVKRYAEKGDTRLLRNWAIKYVTAGAGIPAGTQASRIVDGIIIISDGGPRDASGKLKFPITEDKEKLRTLLYGPFSTKAGQEYIKARKRPNIFESFFTEEKPTIKGRSKRSGARR